MSTDSAPPPVAPEPVAPDPPTADRRFGARASLVALLVIANGATWAEFFPPIITLFPLRVRAIAPDDYTTALSIALTISAVVGLLVGPIAGAISDRSLSRFGRRRFWLITFSAIGAVGNVIMGFSADMVLFTVGACIGQVGFAATTAVLFALIPEHIPAERRGKFGALLGVTTAVSTVVGIAISAALAATPGVAWIALSVLGLGGVTLLVAFLRDAPFTGERPPFAPLDVLRAFWISPRRYPDFGWAWLSRFALYMAFAAITTYQTFYLIDQIRVGTPEDAARYAGLGTVSQVILTVVGAGLGGFLSDRAGRRKPFVIGAALVGLVALITFATATTIPQYLVAAALTGIASGCYASVDIALVTSLLPGGTRDAGKNLGVVNVANMLPNTIAPAIAPLLLGIGGLAMVAYTPGKNYTTLFLGSAVFALISAVALLKVKSVR